MAGIHNYHNEVQLFIVGKGYAPLDGIGTELRLRVPPLHVLFRVGAIETPVDKEYFLGLQRSSSLMPTTSQRVEALSESAADDCKELASRFPQDLNRGVIESIPDWLTFDDERDELLLARRRRIGVLVPLSSIRELCFTVEEGFGLFLDLDSINDLHKHMCDERKKIQSAQERGELFSSKIPRWRISETQVSFDLSIDFSTIQFLHTVLGTYAERLSAERAAQWNDFLNMEIGGRV